MNKTKKKLIKKLIKILFFGFKKDETKKNKAKDALIKSINSKKVITV